MASRRLSPSGRRRQRPMSGSCDLARGVPTAFHVRTWTDAGCRCGRRTGAPSCLSRSVAPRRATTSSESRPTAGARRDAYSTPAPTRRHSIFRPTAPGWRTRPPAGRRRTTSGSCRFRGTATAEKYLSGPVRGTPRAVFARRPMDRVLLRRVGPVPGVRPGGSGHRRKATGLGPGRVASALAP